MKPKKSKHIIYHYGFNGRKKLEEFIGTRPEARSRARELRKEDGVVREVWVSFV